MCNPLVVWSILWGRSSMRVPPASCGGSQKQMLIVPCAHHDLCKDGASAGGLFILLFYIILSLGTLALRIVGMDWGLGWMGVEQ